MKNLFVILAVLMLCSCATRTKIEYADRDVVKYQKEVVHDTLIQHTYDSVYHTVFQKGDTVYDTKYVEKTKWRDRIVYKTDTCHMDSIQTQKKETATVKEVTPKWCYHLLFIIAIIIIIYAIRTWLRAKLG